jgi:hypothetical protein
LGANNSRDFEDEFRRDACVYEVDGLGNPYAEAPPLSRSWVYANSMIDSWESIPYDGSPDLDYEDALYRHGLGEDSDEDDSWRLKYC